MIANMWEEASEWGYERYPAMDWHSINSPSFCQVLQRLLLDHCDPQEIMCNAIMLLCIDEWFDWLIEFCSTIEIVREVRAPSEVHVKYLQFSIKYLFINSSFCVEGWIYTHLNYCYAYILFFKWGSLYHGQPCTRWLKCKVQYHSDS